MLRHGWLDPGAATGYAILENDVPVEIGEIPWGTSGEAVWRWLTVYAPDLEVLGCENYRIRPAPMTKGHANTWSESHESQIIGGARLAAFVYVKEFVTQEPSIKPVGYGFAGLKYVAGKPGMHMQDAIAHGSYWWFQHGRKRGQPQA